MVEIKCKAKRFANAGIFFNFIALVVAVYGLVKSPEIFDIIFFIGILIFIVFYFIVFYIITNFLDKLDQIEINRLKMIEIKKDLNNLNDSLDLVKRDSELDVRLFF